MRDQRPPPRTAYLQKKSVATNSVPRRQNLSLEVVKIARRVPADDEVLAEQAQEFDGWLTAVRN